MKNSNKTTIKTGLQKNEFHDINRFPIQEGILVFGISMSNIANTQNAEACFKHLEELTQKIIKPHVGANFIYSDTLYLYQKGDPASLNKKHLGQMISHKYQFMKILNKNRWYIQKAFSFTTWNQLILESKEFQTYFGILQGIYKKDKDLQKYVKEDIRYQKRRPTKRNILFVLEEVLLMHLISKGKVRLFNEYVQDKEKWILWCYPGPPLKSEIYLSQKNPFKLKNPPNKYENSCYDLKKKLVYDFKNVDLKNLKLT